MAKKKIYALYLPESHKYQVTRVVNSFDVLPGTRLLKADLEKLQSSDHDIVIDPRKKDRR